MEGDSQALSRILARSFSFKTISRISPTVVISVGELSCHGFSKTCIRPTTLADLAASCSCKDSGKFERPTAAAKETKRHNHCTEPIRSFEMACDRSS